MDNAAIIQNHCFGCRSCEQVCPKRCINIKPSQEGFLYAYVQGDQCVHCGLCLKACPAQQTSSHRNKPQKVYAFRNRNTEEIMHSASGGAADVAAKVVLQQKGIVYGAAYDDRFVVKHIEVTDELGKERLQSSKYVQSDTNDCYSRAKAALSGGRKVLFTGTPCQVAGLYAFLGEDHLKLFTLDLICHGVPSPLFFKKYLDHQRQVMNGDILYYDFRSKEKRGWGTQYFIQTEAKTKTQALTLDRYGKHFMNGDCFRESCYQCPYSNIERVGDLTVGDFWGIVKSHPTFSSSRGVSSVFINTEKGQRLFEEMRDYAEVELATMAEGLVKQGNLIKPTERPQHRDDFYEEIDRADYIEKLHVGLQLKERVKAAIPAKVIRLLKRL